jgi:glycosyltransferase involved in cell wall biosynthesis
VRVLWINPFPVFGGPHNTVLTLNEPLQAAGVESVFLLPTEPGSAADRLRAGNVEVLTTRLHRLRRTLDPRRHAALVGHAPSEVAAIRALMRDVRYDVVVLMGLTNPHGALAARLEHTPLVWQILDTATPPAVRAALMPLVRRWSDAVMFNGHALEEAHCGGRPLSPPVTIYTAPVDTDRFHPRSAAERALLRAELGIPSDASVVGTVANINPMKGIEWFVRTAIRVHKARPDSWFLLCGQSYRTHARYRAQIEQQMRVSPVPAERWIIVDGDPARYYPVLDVKLITSVPRSEGRSTTGPEAMACGIPVVASDVGAVHEVIESGRTGIVVPALDAAALAHATLTLLSDPGLRARLGREGRRRAVERYGIRPSLEAHLEALYAALRHHAGRSSVT